MFKSVYLLKHFTKYLKLTDFILTIHRHCVFFQCISINEEVAERSMATD